MRELALDDLVVHKSSYVDPNGFLFSFDGRIFRAIRPAREDFYRTLVGNGTAARLCNDFNVVDSQIVDYQIPAVDCKLVIEHRRIEPTTYCVEWCPSMLKTAALTHLELNLALLDQDCTLQDAYPWNILFESTTPCFVDLTSIVPIEKPTLWPAYQQFINFFINPLKLAAMSKGKMARLLLYDYVNGVETDDLVRNYSLSYRLKHPMETAGVATSLLIANKIQSNAGLKRRFQRVVERQQTSQSSASLRKRFFKRLIAKVEAIKVGPAKTTWRNYYEDIDVGVDVDKKVKVVEGLLSELRPATVLDVGSNTGRFSILAAKQGARVVSLDSSEECIEQLFHQSASEKHSITPLVVDILNPTPPFGMMSDQFPPLTKRIRSDVVLFLGIMHHLHINGRQSFERIASMLNMLAKKAVIFEYVDSTDDNIHLLDHGREIDYSLDSVSAVLSKHFKLSFEESDRKGRTIILCKK